MDFENDEDYTTQQLLWQLALDDDDDDDIPTSKPQPASEHIDTPLTTAQSSTPGVTPCAIPSMTSESSSQSPTPCPTPSITTQASEHESKDSPSSSNGQRGVVSGTERAATSIFRRGCINGTAIVAQISRP